MWSMSLVDYISMSIYRESKWKLGGQPKFRQRLISLCNTKKSLVWVNFSRQKVLLWPKTNFHLIGPAEEIAFYPYDKKVEFWPFWRFWPAVYNTVVTLELPHWCSWLHWSLLTPFMRVFWHGSPYGVLEGRYKNTCWNYGKIHSYAAVNTFYPPQKIIFVESFNQS